MQNECMPLRSFQIPYLSDIPETLVDGKISRNIIFSLLQRNENIIYTARKYDMKHAKL